jgi:hypothetical protein
MFPPKSISAAEARDASVGSIEVELICGFFISARESGGAPSGPREGPPDESVCDALIDEAEVQPSLLRSRCAGRC